MLPLVFFPYDLHVAAVLVVTGATVLLVRKHDRAIRRALVVARLCRMSGITAVSVRPMPDRRSGRDRRRRVGPGRRRSLADRTWDRVLRRLSTHQH